MKILTRPIVKTTTKDNIMETMIYNTYVEDKNIHICKNCGAILELESDDTKLDGNYGPCINCGTVLIFKNNKLSNINNYYENSEKIVNLYIVVNSKNNINDIVSGMGSEYININDNDVLLYNLDLFHKLTEKEIKGTILHYQLPLQKLSDVMKLIKNNALFVLNRYVLCFYNEENYVITVRKNKLF